MRPVFEPDPERLADQQRAKAGAVEEEVAFDRLAGFEDQRFDVTALAVLPDL